MQKDKPIIMSAESVRAILDGRKTMTRRVVKFNEGEKLGYKTVTPTGFDSVPWTPDRVMMAVGIGHMKHPYQVGDLLWVRETCVIMEPSFASYPTLDEYLVAKSDKLKWSVNYCATDRIYKGEKKTQSIYMPKWATRLWLEVTQVRVERLQDISVEDIHSEGVACSDCWTEGTPYKDFPHPEYCGCKNTFMNGWDSLNAKRGYSWESNPWVWVITFRRIKC